MNHPNKTEPALPPDRPATLAEWLWYVRHYQQTIFVREQNDDGRWETVALAELPLEKQSRHIARWLDNGMTPARVIEDPK